MDVSDEVHLEQVLTEDDCSFIFDCGRSCQITMDSRLEVLEAVWKHLTHFAINAQLTQLREGLRGVLNFSTLMDMHPAAVFTLLSTAHVMPVTADQLLDCFVYRYSDEGSNQLVVTINVPHMIGRIYMINPPSHSNTPPLCCYCWINTVNAFSEFFSLHFIPGTEDDR